MEIVLALLVVILLVFVVIAVRTWQFSRTAAAASLPFPAQLSDPRLDPMLAAQHLSAAIQVQTVSHEDPAQDHPENFAVLHQLLRQEYPLLHQHLQCDELEGGSLLYTWSGKDPSLEPVLFMAHQDVVPADEHTLNKWTYPPFSGAIADGFIWGRGSMDIKCQLIAILDAVENLLSAGFQPLRTVFLAFSHDEEVLGFGARRIVARLQQQIRFGHVERSRFDQQAPAPLRVLPSLAASEVVVQALHLPAFFPPDQQILGYGGGEQRIQAGLLKMLECAGQFGTLPYRRGSL